MLFNTQSYNHGGHGRVILTGRATRDRQTEGRGEVRPARQKKKKGSGRIRDKQQTAYTEQLHLLQEPGADGHERLFRPLVEPVDGRAVGDGRELSATDTQRGAHRGETQHHLQHVGREMDEGG